MEKLKTLFNEIKRAQSDAIWVINNDTQFVWQNIDNKSHI